MKQRLGLAGLAVVLGVASYPAAAQDKIKIGVIVTLSGPAAALGQQVRDGFALGVKDLGGKMGGKDVEVAVVDDELKPDAAVTKVKGLLEGLEAGWGCGDAEPIAVGFRRGALLPGRGAGGEATPIS